MGNGDKCSRQETKRGEKVKKEVDRMVKKGTARDVQKKGKTK